MGAYVFREAFLRTMTHIQAAEIDSYGQGNTFFKPARNCLHETPPRLQVNGEGWVFEGGNDGFYNNPGSTGIATHFGGHS